MLHESDVKPPLINCHTHLFTGDHVPPWLAKTFLLWPFYYLVSVSWLVRVCRWWFWKGPYRWQFKPWYKRLVWDVFGYDESTQTIKYNLNHLKLCFGHFGGEDEWARFFELDRDNHSSQLLRHPDRGLEFLKNRRGMPVPGKLEQMWKSADWYTIICSLMLQYPNVYADISYILHDGQAVFPLLKFTLQNPQLRQKVLYGTDFYVVRNHKSDKNIHADVLNALSEAEYDWIGRENPVEFLRRK